MTISRAGALALGTLIDPAWCARRLPEVKGSISHLAEALEQRAPSLVRSAVNPLIDLEFIADRYLNGEARLSALEVAVRYASDLLPLGVSPHPLIDGDLFRVCHPDVAAQEQSGAVRSWVERLLKEPDHSEHQILPYLDPEFVLRETATGGDALRSRGSRSVSRLYLGELAYHGIRPHPFIDPVFLYADREGVLPSAAELADRGGFLVRELRLYEQQATKGGRASPSIGFDEELLRSNPFVARAIEEGRYANAFHAYVANAPHMSGQALSKSGIHVFPGSLTPQPWWKLDRKSPTARRRTRGSEKRLLNDARLRLSTVAPPPVRAQIEGDLPKEVRLGQNLSVLVHGYAMSPVGRLIDVELEVGHQRMTGSF